MIRWSRVDVSPGSLAVVERHNSCEAGAMYLAVNHAPRRTFFEALESALDRVVLVFDEPESEYAGAVFPCTADRYHHVIVAPLEGTFLGAGATPARQPRVVRVYVNHHPVQLTEDQHLRLVGTVPPDYVGAGPSVAAWPPPFRPTLFPRLELTCAASELAGFAPWVVEYVRLAERRRERDLPPPPHELFNFDLPEWIGRSWLWTVAAKRCSGRHAHDPAGGIGR